jgi:RNA polymerase sigma-70 factor (ECF subfamily)
VISLLDGDDPTTLANIRPPKNPEFEEFYAVHFQPLTVQIFAYTMNLAVAQDIVQEAFCRGLARWKKVTASEDPVAWVRRAAWDLVSRRYRRGVPRTPGAVRLSANQLAMARALSTLPPAQRRAVILHYLADLPASEIARQEDVAESAVMSWLNRGRTALAAQLDEYGERS